MERTEHYNYAFLDEGSKREIRRCILKAVAIPGYQVPFGSRELPYLPRRLQGVLLLSNGISHLEGAERGISGACAEGARHAAG